MPKRANLTDRTVKTVGPGRYSDSTVRGLMLVVRGNSRTWSLRYQIRGRRRDMGLGSFPEISLADARERALDARRLIRRDGKDPLAERGSRARIRTFKDMAEALMESQRPSWRNAKHAAQWSSTLATYAYPKLGAMDVQAVDTDAILGVLRPIWTSRPETASRVRQRLERVLDYASALKARTGENPARWKGHLDNLLARPSKVRAVEHFAALNWRQAPAFWAELAKRQDVDARALRFLILTASRSGEVRGARWREIDLPNAIWIVPANRIKSFREHRIPLVSAAVTLLGEPGAPDELVFPSMVRSGKSLSDTALAALLKRMGVGVTVHGFRSTFRDWAGETTAHPREVIEAALAHKLKDRAESAYARGDLFAKRRKLMQDWADYLVTPPADVIELHDSPRGRAAVK